VASRRFCSITGLVLLPLLLAGCGTLRVGLKVERSMAAGDYAGALATVEKEKASYAGPNSLLYYLDKGALLQRTGDYSTSNACLEEADKLIDELYGTSVTEAAASFLVNDMTMAYVGEDFEQVMVNILKELNYLYAGDLAGALVEARRVNTRLVALADKYNKEMVYRQDAFARYLAAFAYEAEGNYNDAYIDYKKAYQAFQWYEKHYGLPIPREIRNDLLRVSRWMGFEDEHQAWRDTFGGDAPEYSRRPRRRSELLLVIYDGLAPRKATHYVDAPTLDSEGRPYVIKVAFPHFREWPPAVDTVRAALPDGKVADSEVFEPVADIAIQNLRQRIGAITAKAIARATAKYIAASQTRKALKTNDQGVNLLVGLATNIYTHAPEQADTRSWLTLPNRFHVIRLPLAAGTNTLELRIALRGGEIRSVSLPVEVKEGQKKVIPVFVTQ